MYYLILTLIIIALISIAYVWWITRGTNIIADNELLRLETDEDKMLAAWYQANIKPSFDFGIDGREIASAFIERILNRQVDPKHIVIGKDLEEQYYKITGENIDQNNYINLRDLIGKPWEFLIITDRQLYNKFPENDINLNELNEIMLSNLDKGAHEYITGLLINRWEMINKLGDDDIINNSGSYLYIKLPDNNDEEVIVKESIVAARTNKGARINLLCNNWEFETLLKRLKQNVTVSF